MVLTHRVINGIQDLKTSILFDPVGFEINQIEGLKFKHLLMIWFWKFNGEPDISEIIPHLIQQSWFPCVKRIQFSKHLHRTAFLFGIDIETRGHSGIMANRGSLAGSKPKHENNEDHVKEKVACLKHQWQCGHPEGGFIICRYHQILHSTEKINHVFRLISSKLMFHNVPQFS